MLRIEVRIKGGIDRNWADWLRSPSVTRTVHGETVVMGFARDQSALYGLLFRLSGLGLQLVSLTCDSADARAHKEASNM